MWHFKDLYGKIVLGWAEKIGEPQKQWMVDIMIAVQLAVNVLYQKIKEKQLRGEWTSGTLSALAISISTTGRTIFQVWNTYISLNCQYLNIEKKTIKSTALKKCCGKVYKFDFFYITCLSYLFDVIWINCWLLIKRLPKTIYMYELTLQLVI